jgi:hypothetical protein
MTTGAVVQGPHESEDGGMPRVKAMNRKMVLLNTEYYQKFTIAD